MKSYTLHQQLACHGQIVQDMEENEDEVDEEMFGEDEAEVDAEDAEDADDAEKKLDLENDGEGEVTH